MERPVLFVGGVRSLQGGPEEKSPYFQMGHMTKVRSQIHSYVPQNDVCKVSLKKIESKVPFEGVKVNIFALWAQQVSLVGGF